MQQAQNKSESRHAPAVKIIPVKLIDTDWPEGTLKMDYAKKLAESIKAAGLLHFPIAQDLGNGRFKVTVGRHRVFACKEILRWKEIPCTITTGSGSKRAEAMEIAENLFRKPLGDLETRRLLQRWLKWFPAANGKKPGKGVAREVQQILGFSTSHSHRIAATAKNLSEEQLDLLERSRATTSEIDSIAVLRGQEKIRLTRPSKGRPSACTQSGRPGCLGDKEEIARAARATPR
jgi:ParB-like nuclease domain